MLSSITLAIRECSSVKLGCCFNSQRNSGIRSSLRSVPELIEPMFTFLYAMFILPLLGLCWLWLMVRQCLALRGQWKAVLPLLGCHVRGTCPGGERYLRSLYRTLSRVYPYDR